MSASTYVPAIWDVVASNLSASSVLAAPLTTSSTSPLKPARWMMEAVSMSPVSPIAIIVTSALVREERYRIGAAVAPADVSATGAQRTAGAGAAAAAGVATAAVAASGVAYGTTGDGAGAATAAAAIAGSTTTADSSDVTLTSRTVPPTRNEPGTANQAPP